VLVLSGDLRSFDTYSGDSYFNLGGYIYGDKMFNPILGIEARFNISKIGGEVQTTYSGDATDAFSTLEYYRILYATDYMNRVLYVDGMTFGFETSVIINLSNLWKSHSEKWSWSGYLGIGYQKYSSRLIIKDYIYDPANNDDVDNIYNISKVDKDGTISDADFGENPERGTNASSTYLNAGIGVKYRLNERFDIEARGVVNINNEDHFDAAISQQQTYESFSTFNFGVVYKFGSKAKNAIWVHENNVKSYASIPKAVDTKTEKDSDKDGVPDLFDKEPNTPSESRVYGNGVSIDSDRDGIPDYRDDCPFQSGPKERGGCGFDDLSTTIGNPNTKTAIILTKGVDTDGDGVEDKFDKEPNTPPGVKVYANGIAFDSDKDGVPDHMDRCPLTNGNAANDGCPDDEDFDGDGVIDRKDRCPDEKGDASNYGCPISKVTGNVEQELENLASKLKFSRSEGHILKSNNLLILEKIGSVLNQYKATSVRIEVHTNNKPNLKYNLDLSKRRAFAINKYLTTVSGIDSERVEVIGLGGSKPKYDVEVPIENAKNNRVELIAK